MAGFTLESAYLGLVLAGALWSFYRGRIPIEVTALLVLLALMLPVLPREGGLGPILDVEPALSGFGSPAVVMVGSMFVLSAAMARTGAAELVGGVVLRKFSRSELGLQVSVLTLVTVFSSVISDTTTVLVWMPLLLAVCRERGFASSRLLLPLAYASLLGGQWTLIGTRSNVIASSYLRSQDGLGLGFLDFLPVGMCIWLVALGFFVTIGRRFLPRYEDEKPLADRYDVTEYLTEVLVSPGSDMIGRSIEEFGTRSGGKITVLGTVRSQKHLPAIPTLVVRPDDVLVVQGRISEISELLARPGIEAREEVRLRDKTLKSLDLRMVEAVVTPHSPLQGRSLEDLEYEKRFAMSVLAIGRHGRPLTTRPVAEKLQVGDSLLLVGHEESLERLRGVPGMVLLESRSLPVTDRFGAYRTLGLLAVLVLLSASKLVSVPSAMLAAAVAAVLLRCVRAKEALEAIDLRTLLVLAGMIPFGLALEQTGTARALAEAMTQLLSGSDLRVLFAVAMLVTVLLTQVMENAAAAVVLSPVVYETAIASGAAPAPFLLGMAICTSAGFSTPWAHESTLLVLAPGRYRPRHYLSLGIPFTAITWGVTSLVLPWLFPLRPGAG